MITVKIDKYKGYTVEGHARYAEPGKDIVCASVSVLSQSVLMQLQKVAIVQYKIEDEFYGSGDGLLAVKILSTDTKEVQTLINLLATGISEIAEQYPDHVKLEFIKFKEE